MKRGLKVAYFYAKFVKLFEHSMKRGLKGILGCSKGFAGIHVNSMKRGLKV